MSGDDRRVRILNMLPHRLEPGSCIVLYSDGVTERRTTDGGFFGIEGLKDAIASAAGRSAQHTVTSIVAAVLAASTGEMRDDASVLVLALDPS